MRLAFPDPTYPRPELRDNGKRYYRSPSGYSTDHLIQSMDDNELLAYMGVPRTFHANAIAMHDRPLRKDIENWVEMLPYIFRPFTKYQTERPDMSGVGLIFHGPSGTRKTTTAAALLLRMVRMGIPNTDPTGRTFAWHGWCMGRFFDWQEASALFRAAVKDDEADSDAEEIRKALTMRVGPEHHADFAVIDDISRERRTEYNIGELTRILRIRHNRCYPTIITTNFEPKVWEREYGDVFAAFANRAFIHVEF